MRHVMSKTHGLKLRCYADFMIDLNDYLAVFPGSKASDKICETEFNEMFLDIISHSRISQAYVKGVDCKSINNNNI